MSQLLHSLLVLSTLLLLATAAPRPDLSLLSALRGNNVQKWGLNPSVFKENLKIKENRVHETLRWGEYHLNRVERDEYRRPETYAVREEFSLFLICWVEREKLLFLLFQSGFDDAMNMENDNINNSLECLKWSKHRKTEVLIHNF